MAQWACLAKKVYPANMEIKVCPAIRSVLTFLQGVLEFFIFL